jgi:hypothetical protein
MKAISKAVASAIVIASLLGGGAGVAVAFYGAPAAAAHPAPLAASMVEYAL